MYLFSKKQEHLRIYYKKVQEIVTVKLTLSSLRKSSFVFKTRTKLIITLSCRLKSSVVVSYPFLKLMVLDFKFHATYFVFNFILLTLFGSDVRLQLPDLIPIHVIHSHQLTIHGGCSVSVRLIRIELFEYVNKYLFRPRLTAARFSMR